MGEDTHHSPTLALLLQCRCLPWGVKASPAQSLGAPAPLLKGPGTRPVILAGRKLFLGCAENKRRRTLHAAGLWGPPRTSSGIEEQLSPPPAAPLSHPRFPEYFSEIIRLEFLYREDDSPLLYLHFHYFSASSFCCLFSVALFFSPSLLSASLSLTVGSDGFSLSPWLSCQTPSKAIGQPMGSCP